jgi:SAM-dependent methyltransferase
MRVDDDDLAILCCPRCRAELRPFTPEAVAGGRDRRVACSDSACAYHAAGFETVAGKPVLIDFETSILRRDEFLGRAGGSSLPRDDTGRGWKARVRRGLLGRNRCAERFCGELIERVKLRSRRPRVLVIGGGAIGSGAERLYRDDAIELVGTDIYASANVEIVADAHRLPFVDGCFDGVWTQAVLEHVLDPWEVVAEIHRVLKPEGVVYADTPFMQQVHEGAYDFTRFSLSGHRWLFRNFDLIAAGAVGGAGTAFVWSARYLVRAITGNDKIATAASCLFFWARFLDRLGRTRENADAACGVYFFGTKSTTAVAAKDMPTFYERQRAAA